MTADQERHDKSKVFELVGAVVVGLISATIGGLVGWFFVSAFLQGAGKAFDLPFLVEHGRIIAASGIGFLVGLRSFTKTLRDSKRRDSRRALAAETGFEFDAELDEESGDAIQEMLGNGGFFYISNVLKKDFDGTRMIIADVKNKQSSNSEHDHYTHQTVAFIESDEFELPTFDLQPTRMMSNLLASLAGVKDINFDTHQKFSDKYLLSGIFEQRIRAFFDGPLLDFFSEETGWKVDAQKNRLMIYRPNQHLSGEAAKQFMDDAMVVFGAIRDRALNMPSPDDDDDVPPPMSAQQAANQIGGIAGHLIRSRLVTRADVQQLIGEPAPRHRIPDAIRRTKLGIPFLVLFGLIFTVFGSLFATIAMMSEENAKKGDQWIFVLFGSAFVLVGLPILVASVIYRLRTGRLLRRGAVTTGEVLDVHRTGTTVNNERRYLIKIRYAANGETITRSFAAYGAAVKHARVYQESGKPVHVLYIDHQPKRAMWAEGLITALPEYG